MNLTYWWNFVSFDNSGVVVTRWRPLFLKPILGPFLPTIFDPSFIHCQVIVGTTICVVAVAFCPNSQSWGPRLVRGGMESLYEYILRTRISIYGLSDCRILGGPRFYKREPLCPCLPGCRIIGRARRLLSYFWRFLGRARSNACWVGLDPGGLGFWDLATAGGGPDLQFR